MDEKAGYSDRTIPRGLAQLINDIGKLNRDVK